VTDDAAPHGVDDETSRAPEASSPPDGPGLSAREPRPMIERLGLALIAALLAFLFGGVSVASWSGGEPFLAVMAGVGCLMTLWVGALTLLRG
jgi:hypothetical protein